MNQLLICKTGRANGTYFGGDYANSPNMPHSACERRLQHLVAPMLDNCGYILPPVRF